MVVGGVKEMNKEGEELLRQAMAVERRGLQWWRWAKGPNLSLERGGRSKYLEHASIGRPASFCGVW